MAKQGKKPCSFSISEPTGIFPIRHIQHPMLLIFNVPMLANRFGHLFRRYLQRADVIMGIQA